MAENNIVQPGKKKTNFFKRAAGQSLVEFALALGIFLLVVFGVIEFGYAMYVNSTVTSAAREAARYGSSVGENASGVSREIDCGGIEDTAVRIGGVVGVTRANVEVRYDNGPTDTRAWADLPMCDPASPPAESVTVLGDRVQVRIDLPYRPMVGVMPATTLHNADARTIIKDVQISGDYPTAIPVYFTSTVTQTPTNTLVPTDTPTPTSTFTKTVGPTQTSTSTLTATPTRTKTATPTASPTATKTVAPSATPPPCENVEWTVAAFCTCSNKLSFYVTNNNAQTAKLTELKVSWTKASSKMTTVLFGSSTLWTGKSNSPLSFGVAGTSGYDFTWADTSAITLAPGATKVVTVKFADVVTVQSGTIKLVVNGASCAVAPEMP